jgi:glyoxylase-like metal-dependent hydrolase (beta-lactamase superfamily II)
MTAPLSVNVFTAPEKAVVGERHRPFGPLMAWDPITSTLIFGENDAVLVDTLTTTAEAEALAGWVALHHRNLTRIYITHGHIDHFAGLSVLLQRFPNARAIATPKSVELMHKQTPRLSAFRKLWPGQLPAAITLPEPYDEDVFTLEGQELRIIKQAAPTPSTAPPCTCPRLTSSSAATSSTTSATCTSATPLQRPRALRRYNRAVPRLGQPPGVVDVRPVTR